MWNRRRIAVALLCPILAGVSWAMPAYATRTVLSVAALGGTPQVAALTVEGMVSSKRGGFGTEGEFLGNDLIQGKALILGASVGAGGGEVHAGIGKLKGVGMFDSAYGATLMGLRTWGDPWNAEPKETYVGPELFIALASMRLRLGALYRIDGPEARGRLIPRAALGIGYMWGP